MGPLAASIRVHVRVLVGSQSMVFPRRKATSPYDRPNGPKNYMDWPPTVWSQSPADPCWTPVNGNPGPHLDYTVNSSPSTMFRPSRKNMARLSPSVLSKKRLRDDDHKDEPTLDRTPATCGGSREVGLTRRPNTRSQYDGRPIGS